MAVEYCVVSIGTLSHNPLWGERAGVRTAHATTTLVRDGERMILVDPSLPAPALEAHLFERTGKLFADITDVFCTTLRPVHRRSIAAMDKARWWASQAELETHRQYIEAVSDSAHRLEADEEQDAQADLALIERFSPAPDRFGEQVHIYPLVGPSLGSAGLLLTPQTTSVVIAGDAALTAEHVLAGRVWEGSADTKVAGSSLQDILEVADVIIPGHDNLMISPRQWF